MLAFTKLYTLLSARHATSGLFEMRPHHTATLAPQQLTLLTLVILIY